MMMALKQCMGCGAAQPVPSDGLAGRATVPQSCSHALRWRLGCRALHRPRQGPLAESCGELLSLSLSNFATPKEEQFRPVQQLPFPEKWWIVSHWLNCCAQEASSYTPEQKQGLLTAQNVLFARMHEILEAREAIMNTLQVGPLGPFSSSCGLF